MPLFFYIFELFTSTACPSSYSLPLFAYLNILALLAFLMQVCLLACFQFDQNISPMLTPSAYSWLGMYSLASCDTATNYYTIFFRTFTSSFSWLAKYSLLLNHFLQNVHSLQPNQPTANQAEGWARTADQLLIVKSSKCSPVATFSNIFTHFWAPTKLAVVPPGPGTDG